MTSIFLHDLEAFFGWLLAASWQASVLALLVLALQRLLGARLNPRWRYALWLLVLARLILPALPESALSLFQFAPPPPASLVVPVTEPLFVQATALPPQVDAISPEPSHPFSAYSLFAIVWLIGAIGLLILTWQVNRRFARQVANSPEITDPELLEFFAAAKKELGIRRAIRLIESSQVQSPAIMGLFQPTLLLPANVREKFDARELRFIFLHELAHLKRGDVIVQGLIALLQILHWFNPVLWFAFRRMRIDREPATDALVLSRTGEEEKERYGLMLIKLLEHFNQRHSLPTLVGILEEKDQFRRRFSLIARFTRGAYGWSLLGVLLIGILAVACLTKSKSAATSPLTGKTDDQDGKAAIPTSEFPKGSFGLLISGEVTNLKRKVVPNDKNGLRVENELLANGPTVYPTSTSGQSVIATYIDGDDPSAPDKKPRLTLTYTYKFLDKTKIQVNGTVELKDNQGTTVDKVTGQWTQLLNTQVRLLVHGQPTVSVPQPDKTPPVGSEINVGYYLYVSVLRISANATTIADEKPLVRPTSRNKYEDIELSKTPEKGDADAAYPVKKDIIASTFYIGTTFPYASGQPPVRPFYAALPFNDLAPPRLGQKVGVPSNWIQPRIAGQTPHSNCIDHWLRITNQAGTSCYAQWEDFGPGPEDDAEYVFGNSPPKHQPGIDLSPGAAKFLGIDDKNKIVSWQFVDERDVPPGPWFTGKFSTGNAADTQMPMADLNKPQAFLFGVGSDTGPMSPHSDQVSATEVHPVIARFLWSRGNRIGSPLLYAIGREASIEEITKLLSQGSPADPPQDETLTPLGAAAMAGNVDAVKLLIAHGADVNKGGLSSPKLPQYYRMSPLITASGEGQDEIVDYLLQHGATPDPAALLMAAYNSHPYPSQRSKDHFERTVQILVDAGALKGATPEMSGMILAAPAGTRNPGGNATVLKTLLGAGLSPELPLTDNSGKKVNSVIGYYRDWYLKNKDASTDIKPLLDILEAADTGAATKPETPSPNASAQMLEAVKKNDIAGAQKLIDQGVDPAKVQDNGTPLIFRVKSPEMAELLLQHGADANARDKSDAILSYICRGNTGKNGAAIALVLLKHGADPNTRTGGDLKVTSLMEARDGDTVDALLKYGADPKAVDSEGTNVVCYAFWNDPSALEALLRHGIPFDPKTDGAHLMVKSAEQNNLPLVQWLLAHGVDPNTEGLWYTDKNGPRFIRPLIFATSAGQEKIVTALLDHGAKFDGTIMAFAVRSGDPELVKLYHDRGAKDLSELGYQINQNAPLDDLRKLLEKGSPADPPEDKLITPMGEAALQGKMDVVQLLTQHGADVNKGEDAPGFPGYPHKPVVLAASKGQDEIVGYLLAHGATPLPAALQGTLQSWESKRSNEKIEKIVRLLIDAGALRQATPEEQGSILAASIQPSDAVALKMLLDAGVSPNSPLKDAPGDPTTVIAYYRNFYQKYKDDPSYGKIAATIKPLLDMLEAADKGAATKPETPSPNASAQMLDAVQKGDAATLQKLLDQGVDPKTDKDSYPTLLFYAGSPEVAEILIAHGVDVNARDTNEDTLVHLCSSGLSPSGEKNRAAIIRVLLKHGANPNAQDTLGYTPIVFARDGATVDALVEFGAKVNIETKDGRDVMGFDHSSTDLSYFQALERHGYSFAPNAHGSQLLVAASHTQNLEVMKWLLDRGVDPNTKGIWVKSNEGTFYNLPLQTAAIFGNTEAAKLLISRGAKADEPMITALHNGFGKIVKLFWESGVRNISELSYAISQGAPAADLQKLLDKGIPADPPQDKLITPLGVAARMGNMDAVKLLIARNADVNAGRPINPKLPQYYRMSPLIMASGEGQDEIVDYLLQHGATPDPAALLEAANNSHPDPGQRSTDHFERTVRILIDVGALKGATPEMSGMILAAPIGTRDPGGNATVLKILLGAGLSPELPLVDDSGKKLNSVIGYYRDQCIKYKDTSTDIKPLLDLLEAADKTAGTKPSGAIAPTDAANRTKTIAQLNAKLQAIRIDHLVFKDTPLNDVISAVQAKSKQADPAKEGLNFVLRTTSTPPTDAANQPSPTITLDLTNVSLADALKSIEQAAKLQYSVEEYAVYLKPAVDGEEPLTVRTFGIPAKFFQASTAASVDVKQELISKGVEFSRDASAIYLPAKGKLVARDTSGQLDKIAGLLDALEPSQIQLELKVVEIPDDVYQAHRAAIDTGVEKGDAATFNLLNNLKGVSLLSAPSVTTQPGLKANIDIVREFSYPTSFDNGKTTQIPAGPSGATNMTLSIPPTPREFASKDIGIMSEMRPSLDQGKIVVNGKFTLTEFEGFTKSNLVGSGTPSFNTSESYFLEALDDKQEKGIWIPGEHVSEEMAQNSLANGQMDSSKLVKKRFLLFLSARMVRPGPGQ